jgi:hypothetical protein
MNNLEVDLITSSASKKSEGCKALMDSLASRGFHFSKSIMTKNYTYNLYNLTIVFLFVNKVDDLENASGLPHKHMEFESICEALFLHLRDEFFAMNENTSRFFSFFAKTAKNVMAYFVSKLSVTRNCYRKTEVLEKDFVVLLQYLVSDNPSLSKTSEQACVDFINRFPYLFLSQKVLTSIESLVTGLHESVNSKFGSDNVSISPPFFSQGLSFSKITKASTERLSKLLSLVFSLFLNSKAQNEMLTKRALQLFFKQKWFQDSRAVVSLGFFAFLDTIDDFEYEKDGLLKERKFTVGLMDPGEVQAKLDKVSGLIREDQPQNQRGVQTTGRPQLFPQKRVGKERTDQRLFRQHQHPV